MRLFDRLTIGANTILAAVLIIAGLLCLGWMTLLLLSQAAWFWFSGVWASISVHDLVRAVPTQPELWPLTLVPTWIELAAEWRWLLMTPWIAIALEWLGRLPLTLALLATAFATIWISSDLRVMNRRLRAAIARARRPARTLDAGATARAQA